MNLLERVLTLLRANLNAVVEKAEDPEKVLRQLQLDMRNQLVQVKTQVATAIAEGHKLQKRSQERKAQADVWLRKAEQAVQQENDDAAREALTHFNGINKQVQRYQQQKKEQEQLVLTMRGALRQLEAKITEVDTTIDLLLTRRRNALIQQRVFDALNKSGAGKDKENANRAQDAVVEAEARARALAELHKRSLDAQLDQLSAEQQIEQQLQDIKDKQQPTRDETLTTKFHPQTGPLVAPEPPQATTATKQREKARPKQAQNATETSTQRDINLDNLKKLLNTPQTLDS